MKIRQYIPLHHYSQEEQIQMIRDDLLRDAVCAEEQAANGPYYPGVTRESLLAYAAECRHKLTLQFTAKQFIEDKIP